MTQIGEVDEHHEKLVDILNRLYTSVFECESLEHEHELTGGILQELIDYTAYHFSAEEKLLRQYEYPEIDAHVLEHQGFNRKLDELLSQYSLGIQALSFETFEFLRDWLVDHICGADKKYCPHLLAKGAK